jgi:hypothetical protein
VARDVVVEQGAVFGYDLLSKVYIGTVPVVEVEVGNYRPPLLPTDIRSARASVHVLKLYILCVHKERRTAKASKARVHQDALLNPSPERVQML